MKLIVCLDDKNGMLFNHRRQSKDSALRAHILKMTANCRLWMNGYSVTQFAGEKADITVDEDFLKSAGEQDFCFVENTDISAYAHKVTGVIVYRWNREYPRDVIFPAELFDGSWKRISSEVFPGNSHETITQEVYSL